MRNILKQKIFLVIQFYVQIWNSLGGFKMISEKMNAALNKQVNAEMYSAYLYLAMQAYFNKLNLTGFVNWMNVQVQEEMAHAKGLYDYIQERGGEIVLDAIEKPEQNWNSPLDVFEAILKHEQLVTSLINNLADVADETKDRAAGLFLQWYIKEQVEEEASVSGVLDTLRMIKDDAHALLLLDRELAARVFNPPVIG